MKGLLHSFLLLALISSCSSGQRVEKEDNKVATLDNGLYLSESGEDGVMELVVPEVEEYTEVVEEVQEQENIVKMEVGADEDIDPSEDKVDIQQAVITEVIDEEEREEKEALTAAGIENTEDTDDKEAYSEGFEEYIVQKNDSLMLIAFKLYNDFGKWKQIAEWNEFDTQNIKAGDKLRVKMTKGSQGWRPEGNPYLVKQGDYLSKISGKVYEGETKFWYEIWRNNEVLIKNPDEIYAGFTLYTLEKDQVIEQFNARKKGRNLATQ